MSSPARDRALPLGPLTSPPALFSLASWTRFHIYQPDFQSRYISFFSHESSSSRNHSDAPYPYRNLDASGLKWLPLLFIMMAIATLTAPLSLFGDEGTRRIWSRSLYGSARKAINLGQALQRDNLDILAARLLIGRYLLVPSLSDPHSRAFFLTRPLCPL